MEGTDDRSTSETEVVDGLSALLELRGTSDPTSETEGDSSNMTDSAKPTRSRRSAEGQTGVEVISPSEVPITRDWMPPIVSFSSDDIARIVDELLRLSVDVTSSAAARGVRALHPEMAYLRIDVSRRANELAALIMDRTRSMTSTPTSEVPVVQGDFDNLT